MRRTSLLAAPTALLGLTACFAPTGLPGSTSDTSTTTTPATSEPGDASTSTPTSSTSGSTSTSTEPDEPTLTSSSTTEPGVCGDGVVQGGEQCDDGRDNGDQRPCRADCVLGFCGDGVVCSGCAPAEQCDGAGDPLDGCDNVDCTLSVCGDDLVDETEECEPNIDGDCTQTCLRAHHYVFVSSAVYNGDLGGLAGADALCMTLAKGHFSPKRTFIAWLSAQNDHILNRMGPGPHEYIKANGEVVAMNRPDLLDGTLESPIDRTEAGDMVDDPPCSVWTGTQANGFAALESCGTWNRSGEDLGRAGTPSASDLEWSTACDTQCFNALRIYCVEQS